MRAICRLHRLEAAEKHFDHIRNAGEKVTSPYAMATGLSGLADIARYRGAWQLALEHLQAALTLFAEVGSPAGVARTNRRMGRVLFDQGLYEEAKSHFETAHNVALTLANPRLWASTHQAMAEVHKELGEIKEAKQRARQGLEIRKILDHPLELAESWSTLGVCHDLVDEHEEAAECLARALKHAESIGFEPTIAYVLWLSASLAIDRGVEAPSEEWAARVEELTRRVNMPQLKAMNAALQVRLAARKGDEFKLHNRLLDVETAYAALPGLPPLEMSPTSAYLDSAVFYLSLGRTRRSKELADLSRKSARKRPYPRLEELRGLPKGGHTADFEAVQS